MEWVLGKTQGEVWASEKSAVKIRFFFLRLPHFHLEWHFTIRCRQWWRAAFNAICQRSCCRTSVVNGKVNGGNQETGKLGDWTPVARWRTKCLQLL